jgi:uncharacterized protein with PhoU and TrkA domain
VIAEEEEAVMKVKVEGHSIVVEKSDGQVIIHLLLSI